MFKIKDLNEYLASFLDIKSHSNLIKINKLFKRTFDNPNIWKYKLKEKLKQDFHKVEKLNYKKMFIELFKVDKFVERVKNKDKPINDDDLKNVNNNDLEDMESAGFLASLIDQEIENYLESFIEKNKSFNEHDFSIQYRYPYEYLENEMNKYKKENTSLMVRVSIISPILYKLKDTPRTNLEKYKENLKDFYYS